MNESSLPAELRDRVLLALGFNCPPLTTVERLDAMFRSWCRCVPFDNVRKRMVMAQSDQFPLPGRTAADFFAHFLRHGTGGTCWSTANALHELLTSCGFEARRATGDMMESGKENHGTVIVTIEGKEYLVDPAIACEQSILLESGATTDPESVHPVAVRAVDDTFRIAFQVASRDEPGVCRLVATEVTDERFNELHELSREDGPFNDRLHVRRNIGGKEPGTMSIIGHELVWRKPSGFESKPLDDGELRHALMREFDFSAGIVHALFEHGLA